MKTYYSATTGLFYNSELFGTKTLTIIDPEFEWPKINLPDPTWEGEAQEAPTIEINDEDVIPPMMEIANPDSTLPNDAVEISQAEHQKLLEGQGRQRIISDGNGHPTLADFEPEDLSQLIERKRREIDTARDTAFAVGLEYDFNGETDVVQTRPQDQINLLGLSAQAQRLIAAGQPSASLIFRGLKNVNRELSAMEIDVLTLAALGHIEEIYQKSWALKDQLDAAFKAENREAIEQLDW
uniref:DUF4376 domain-containing protein n=1 Tax=Halomonas phage vB_HboP_4908 TaxID=3350578 RepID=A0AB74UJT2_9VIRU